jgi:hypothetical protein
VPATGWTAVPSGEFSYTYAAPQTFGSVLLSEAVLVCVCRYPGAAVRWKPRAHDTQSWTMSQLSADSTCGSGCPKVFSEMPSRAAQGTTSLSSELFAYWLQVRHSCRLQQAQRLL